MSNEHEYYQDVTGVQPWIPPVGYENPVPPARGDALPAGHKRSLLAGLRSGRDDAGDATSTVRWLIIVVVLALFVWFTVVPWIEEQVDRGSGLLDDIEKTIDDARESIEQGSTTGKKSSVADGKSNLPGGYASLNYAVLSDETEWTQKQDRDDAYNIDIWGVDRTGSAGESQLSLSHYTPDPPLSGFAEYEMYADFGIETYDVKPGSTPERSLITVDGRDGFEYRFVDGTGADMLVTYFFGDRDAFDFVCAAAEGDDEFYSSCDEAQQSLSFRS